MKKENLVKSITIIILFLAFFVGINYLLAWDPAPANPPSDNVARPINVSNTFQSKGGGSSTGELLNINGGLSSNGLGVFGAATVGGTLKVNSLANNSGKHICAQADGTVYLCP